MNLLDEIKNSINSVIAERSVSPLFGSLLLSWLTWNWKILYVLFGNGEHLDYEDRLEYIEINLSSYSTNIFYPLISALIILLIYPFVSILAYWLWLKFDILKKKIRNETEKNELLTLEESIKVRIEIQKSKDFTSTLILEKEKEIDELKKEMDILISEKIKIEKDNKKEIVNKQTQKKEPTLKKQILANKLISKTLNTIFKEYQKGTYYKDIEQKVDKNSLDFLNLNRIVYESYDGEITLNYLGKEMYNEYLKNLLNKHNDA